MMLCEFSFTARDDGRYDALCSKCGRTAVTKTTSVAASCRLSDKPMPLQSLVDEASRMSARPSRPTGGPGTELKALLRDWLGITASPGCSCNAMAAEMDAKGPDWCESEAGSAKILSVMRTEHGKRWQSGKTRLPWTDLGAKTLIRLACHRARKRGKPLTPEAT